MLRVLGAVQWQADHFEEIPVIVVACLRGPRLPFPPIMASSYYGSIYPSVQNLLLAARTEGLGTALTTLLCAVEPKVKELLAIPDKVATAALIALGYPEKGFPKNLARSRKPVSEIAFADTYGNAAF